MTRPRGWYSWLAVALAATTSAAAGSLDGLWEGEVEGSRRPFRAELTLEDGAGGPTATFVLDGRFELPVAALDVGEEKVAFATNLNGQDYTVRMTRDGDRLHGTVDGGDAGLAIALYRLPRYAAPADRAEAWAQDLEVVRTRFLRFDRSFDDATREAARKALAQLADDAATLNDEAIVVRLSEIVATSGNAHTRLYLLRNRTALRRMPIRTQWFRDGLHVVQATEKHADLLGCRVTAIGDSPVETAQDRVARLFAGNASWRRYKGPYFLTSPEILAGTGIVPGMASIRYRVGCDGGERTVALAPLPLEPKSSPTEAWRELSPIDREPGWRHVLESAPALPLALQHPGSHYWMAEPTPGTLYFQYSRSQDAPQGPPLEAFAARLLARLEELRPARLVIDLRHNTGGNTGVGRSLFDALAGYAREHADRKVFLVTGRATFSAGIYHAAQLAVVPGVVLIGEPVGDELDTWSEGGNLVLPNSGLTVHYTNGFHGYSKREYPDRRFFADLDLDDRALEPHVYLEPTYADYRAGRDPVVDAILGRWP